MAKNMNFLGGRNRFLLLKWIDENRKKIEAQTVDETLKLANESLGFVITKKNLSYGMEVAQVMALRSRGLRAPSNSSRVVAKAVLSIYEWLENNDFKGSISNPQLLNRLQQIASGEKT